MVRLQFHTTDDVVKELDRRAAIIGISRNAMCAVLLHNALFGQSDPPGPGEIKVDLAGPAGKED